MSTTGQTKIDWDQTKDWEFPKLEEPTGLSPQSLRIQQLKVGDKLLCFAQGCHLECESDDVDEYAKETTEDLIIRECDAIKELLIEKNRKYGDSAISNGIVFDIPATTAIKARINDKLSRLRNDSKDEDEDIIQDLLGYFILLRIAQKKTDLP
jgi:hypothetical protein